MFLFRGEIATPKLLQSLARASSNHSTPLAAAAALLAEARSVVLPELGVERSVAQAVVDALRGKMIINAATGIRARLSSSARGKLVSNKPTGKSKANGFSQQQHNAIVARIAEIYEAAVLIVSRPDREGDANILSIKRFAAKVKFGRQSAVAWITVKESKLHGHHIYSVEAIKLEALDRIVEVVSGNTPHASSAPTRSMVAFFSSCVNAVFGKISTHRSLLAAAAALLLLFPVPCSLFPLSAFAAEQKVIWQDQEIWVENGALNFLPSGELVIKYADPAAVGTLRLPADVKIEGRILAVGGGGGGGTIQGSKYASYAGGGGGGAGELVDRTVIFNGEKFLIAVGAGGTGGVGDGTAAVAAKAQGGNGGASAITNVIDETSTEYLLVNGGGGGGGQAAGLIGGSGGGSSAGSKALDGSAAAPHEKDGHGTAGGGSINGYAGGGGGAGAEGAAGVDGVAGAGGDGLMSNITGDELWYAGGGGGGTTYSGKTVGAKGKGGGGLGAGVTKTTIPTAGDPETGGGGGGGSRYWPGQPGGSGVVIIRLIKIDKPIDWKEIDLTEFYDWGGKLEVDAEAFKTVERKGDELLITYSNTTSKCGIRVTDGFLEARALLIGGGGAGGSGYIALNGNATPGGGGGGGFVETNSVVLSGTYNIVVGAGGAQGTKPLSESDPGKDGGQSSIQPDGTVDPYFCQGLIAYGGGGGGAQSAGRDGASGGGGSSSATAIEIFPQPGGKALYGSQGNAGADGNQNTIGGGGGGAGGAAPAITMNSALGGEGLSSDITGQTLYYSAGGGGSCKDTFNQAKNFVGGSNGVGGRGGMFNATETTFPEYRPGNGMDGRGGGGGGGCQTCHGGKGGDGIVIIRIRVVVPFKVPVPKGVTDYVYDGTEKTGTAQSVAYTLAGQIYGTNADNYLIVATLNPNLPDICEWADGREPKRGDRDVRWTINQLKVEVPGASTNFIYNGEVQSPVFDTEAYWIEDDWAWTTNNTAGKPLMYCHLEDDGADVGYKRTDAGFYTVRAVLNTEGGTTNFTWASHTDGEYPWKILQAPNAITDFYYPGYRWPDRIRAHHPTNQFYVAFGRETAKTDYRTDNGDGTYGEWTDWGEDGPAANGNYEVRVAIDTTENWQGTTNVLAFGTWHEWDDIFTDRMQVSVPSGKASSDLTDFPLPVRVRMPEKDGYGPFSGYDYVRAGTTGTEIRFFDEHGDPVPHDVDYWNVRGESLVWVRVPTVWKSAETKLTMCWRRVNGIAIPPYDGTAVWSRNYAGVWHMTKLEGRDIPDASANDRSVFPTGGATVKFDSKGKLGREGTVLGGELHAANVFTNAGDAAVLHAYNQAGTLTVTTVRTTDRQIVVAADGKTVDEARLLKAAPSSDWTTFEKNVINGTTKLTYGLVIREGQLCDYWASTPSVTPQVSKEGTPPTVNSGSYSPAAVGGGADRVTGVYRAMPDGEWLPMPIPAGITRGYYQAMFDHTNPSGQVDGVWYEYRPQSHATDFYIIEKIDPTHDLGGFGGDSGRILLMNSDNRPEYAVTNQGWCAQSQPGTVTNGVTCWWMTAGDADDGTNNIMGGTSFELVRCSDTNVLWTLTECRQGNTFPTNEAETLSAGFCYLPPGNSGLAPLSITNESVKATQRGDAGWVMMRNAESAEIRSSWFTNGIGTIYFDAVNSRKSVAGNADGYKLVLEIDRYTDTWERVTMYPTVVHGTTYTDQPATNELALAETTDGDKDHYFYRVHVPLVKYGPVRFRIRRTTTDMTVESVDDGFILMDNIIVSVPPVSATLEPYGHFDPKLAGDAAVGMGGAFEVPFPSATGPKFPGRCRVTLPPGTPYAGKPISDYISMAQMFYRWRYLGEAEDWRMAVLEGTGTDTMATAADLEIPDRPGDVEFYFVSMMKSDYYGYVDYSRKEGSGKVSKSGYTEEITKKESVMDLSAYHVSRLASGGTNWFVRLRDGASDFEGMTLEVRGKAFTNSCPMRLVEDGGWRGLFAIPTNAEGTCTFRFHGRNRQTAGAAEYAFNTTDFGGGAEAVELPRNGVLSVGGAATPFEVDHVANYIEFRLGADASANPTWSASRAEYQNFNDWHDVWSSPESQTFSPGTNGVNTVAMQTKTLDNSSWRLYAFEDGAWNEMFTLVNYNDPGFPKETFYQNHKTPSVWNGYNLTFVSKNLSAWVDPGAADTKSGMAAKLQGQGGGILEYNKSNNPKGLENVRFTARIGQSIGYDSISYSDDNSKKKDYTFVCPVSMSRSISDDTKAGDMSVGGAISLFAYYRESLGCYEFRVTRAASGTEVLMELFKWHPVDGAMEQERLCGQRFNSSVESMKLWNNSGEVTPKYFGMFISVKNESGQTKVWGGLGKDEWTVTDDTTTFSGSRQAANGYGGLYYVDKDDDRLQSGSYGVAAKDCPAQFVRPRHYDWPVDSSAKGATDPKGLSNTSTYKAKSGATGQYFKASGNRNFSFATDTTSPIFDYQDITDGFWELGQQIERWDASRGLRTPVGLKQDVVVMLQDKSGGDWFEAGKVPVSGYALAEKTLPLHLTGDFNLRITTGKKAVDVVIGEVKQRQWQGLDHENLNYGSDQFVYTQGVVGSNDLRRTKETLLQPSRGLVTKPLSVRSPVLSGLGKVSFSYEDADKDAVVWVQVATNSVEYNLTGNDGYNLSVKSVERGEPEPVGTWITVAKFGEDPDECPDGPLGRSGVRTVYLGWHDQANAPVKGVFRVFIPPETVANALVVATNRTQNVDYGRISVTGMTVTDEPGISERSWRGWNLRTIGGIDERGVLDTEGRMFLDDGLLSGDIGYGLTCGLNNSINDLADEDAETAAFNNPAVWSPTFEQTDGKSRSIGSVSFRARLYYAGDARETETGGIVSVYGATSALAENWTKLVDIRVTGSTFSNYTWTALGETRYRAMKLEVSGQAAKTRNPDRDRVIVDEVVLTEKLDAKIGFEYVRPFRTNLYDPVVIEDIESPSEQPLVGESWGVQTKLRLEQLGRDVSGLEVYLQTFTGESPWGYGMWKDRGSKRMKLEPVGDPKDGIFRSVGRTADALVQPVSKASTVQYMVILQYAGEGEETAVSQYVEKEDWAQPSWYWPVDLNEQYGGNRDPDKFSPYTILDTVSPGRAWINEVNWNDGPKEETGTSETVVSNQFIEICVPSGVDMTDWYLRATDLNANQWTMAMFGQQLPVRKISGHATNGFEFVVVESPATQLAGGVKDPDGQPVADGAWGSDGPNGSAAGGTLNYSFPWQFELVRPSGIVEHQFVLQGTNEWADWSFGGMYDGTNLVAKLNEKIPSTKRFYAAEETSKRRDGRAVGSAGVVGGNSDANPPPGGEGTWANRLRFTAGRLNEGQIIPKDWFIAPSGTNAWVYLSVEGSHISQAIGDDTNRYTMVLVPQGATTNVLYTADPWYETATISVRDASGRTQTVPWHQPGESTYAFAPSGTVYITATEGFDSGLERFNIGLEPGKSKYSRAVVNWLAKCWPDATPDDIRLARYMNLVNENVITNLTLTEMYWFDIPPVNSEGNPSEESEWWLRGGFWKIRPQAYIREGFNGVLYTNSQFDVRLYISNDWTRAAFAPPRLQGIANERSDEPETYSGGWTSVTFKIRGALINGEPGNKGFLPFRMFTFGPGSFTGPADETPFMSTIEILDPFSSASPGHSYGWDKYPNTMPFWFKWSVDTDGVPDTVSTLKAKDTYGD